MYRYLISENLKNVKERSVALSFDIRLQNQLDSLLNARYPASADSVNVLASITSMDGNFKVKVLSQNSNTSEVLQINPNLLSSITELNLLLYHLDKTTRDGILQKRGLESTDKPGSTIKPFTYSSVISGFNTQWQQLHLDSRNNHFKDNASTIAKHTKSYIEYFAWKKVGN